MTPSEKYPIERYIMTQNDCYKSNKRRTPTGIQVHSVGCKGTNRDRWRRWNTSGLKKCANAFIDTNGIMQTLDWDVKPWLSGSGSKGNANNWCVGFEICEPSAANDTPEAAAYLYGCVLYLCTELCKDYGIDPREIKCHCELAREGNASNHADVNHWWGKPGTSWEPYTMPRLRHDVAEALGIDLMEGVDLTTMTLKKGMQGEAVRALQEMLNELGFDCGAVDGIYGKKTEGAVKAFQYANGLQYDGIAGQNTLTLLAAKCAKPEEPAADAGEDAEPAEEQTADPADLIQVNRNEVAAIRDALLVLLTQLNDMMLR